MSSTTPNRYRPTLYDEYVAVPSRKSVRFIFHRELVTAHAHTVPGRDSVSDARFTALDQGNALAIEAPMDVLMHFASRLLGRKVFSSLEFQQSVTEDVFNGLGELVCLLNSLRTQLSEQHAPQSKSIRILLDHILCLIIMNWPNNHSAESGLPEDLRPPLALRIALDYIVSCDGLVGHTEDVAHIADVSLRTLEGLFATWLKVGVGRYCKLLRIKLAFARWTQTREAIHTLAEEYHFTNITRFKRDLESFDLNMMMRIMPNQFYSDLVTDFPDDYGDKFHPASKPTRADLN